MKVLFKTQGNGVKILNSSHRAKHGNLKIIYVVYDVSEMCEEIRKKLCGDCRSDHVVFFKWRNL
jgi:hypothetical protein